MSNTMFLTLHKNYVIMRIRLQQFLGTIDILLSGKNFSYIIKNLEFWKIWLGIESKKDFIKHKWSLICCRRWIPLNPLLFLKLLVMDTPASNTLKNLISESYIFILLCILTLESNSKQRAQSIKFGFSTLIDIAIYFASFCIQWPFV